MTKGEALLFGFASDSTKWQPNRQMKLDVTLLAGQERSGWVSEGRPRRSAFLLGNKLSRIVGKREGSSLRIQKGGNNRLDLGYSSNRNIIPRDSHTPRAVARCSTSVGRNLFARRVASCLDKKRSGRARDRGRVAP